MRDLYMYYQLVNDRSQGPYSFGQLQEMARLETFTPASLVWYDLQGKWQWVEAKRIAEFVELFRAIENEAVTAARLEAREIRREVAAGLRPPTTIIAVGGGKGGIGKTSLTVGLGLCLAAMEQSVILVDCDLGGANLRTALGLPEPQLTSVDFFVRSKAAVDQLLTPTGVDSLQFISGQGGVLGLANLKYSQKLKFINQLKKLEADFVLLDLGAGTSYDVLDFFLASDRGVLITCPDPFSLESAFGFLKTAMYRGIARSFSSDEIIYGHIKKQMDRAFRMSMFQFLTELRVESPESADIVWKYLAAYPKGLILNMVRRRDEIKSATELIAEASRQLSVKVELLGQVSYDALVRKSTLERSPFVLTRPTSKASRDLLKIVSEKLLPRRHVEGPALQRWAIRQMRQVSSRRQRPLPSDEY
jgi:flagellar biosynthesis protein FlhG